MGKKGKLEIIAGCMFSGKTKMISQIISQEKNPKKYYCYKPDTDNRGGLNYISTNYGENILARVLPFNAPEEIFRDKEIFTSPKNGTLIIIDEVQFFSKTIMEVTQSLLKQGLDVIAAGLDLDFRGEPFGFMPQLMAAADKITKLTATCTVCGEKANRTQRIINGEPAHYNDPLILIGGSNKYEARCIKHHIVPGKPEIIVF